MQVLSIAGSDPSSGAGIQGDIKTFTALGAYGLSIVTAVTSQNTLKFFDVEAVSPSIIRGQIKSILSDFHVDAIKIGMVYSKKAIMAIHSELKRVKIPIILDPIFESTTGGILLQKDAILYFKKLLVPIAHIITPNVLEAEKLANIKIRSLGDIRKAAIKIQKLGARGVVIKGGHLQSNKVTDILLEDHKFHTFSHNKILFSGHGGGCTFSAALCVNIAKGKGLKDAVKSAQDFTLQSMKNTVKVGRGLSIVTQKGLDVIENDLSCAVTQFVEIEGIYRYIPECQTNFVYSRTSPTSIADILGLEGRIVKTGKSVTVAGSLKYGGSKHVALSVLEITKKHPTVRSALNIKYDKRIIEKAIKKKLGVFFYDRNIEPDLVRGKEGKTISWGTRNAIKGVIIPPDIIYHKGSIGKEPMILIFGESPKEVLTKLLKIIR
ncbi:MAG: bifunctional hydroxymethylpyrimidine kinase/phosphomethylpyrimidine kinase [Thaumarchaeota archaeon]|nr:MAG: bifunctional hydroxymethylpyrimidine kinase/phosphomethylpyrimidine kinase [Nitrososphaerota archaeon]